MEYRKDIDGLRAVAILSIIFYHFECTKFFGGGFVGVDIFFVISGYLITNILYSSLKNDSFSLVEFYERRIRRIIPAFAFMLISCLVVGFALLTGSNFLTLIKTILVSLGMMSNFYFWRDGGYFTDPTFSKPLLHTWSLSIEEQFYLFFPIVLYFIYKRKLNLILWLRILFFASFILSAVAVFYKPNATFFLPVTRAWELLLGSLLAIQHIDNANHSKLPSYYGYLGLIFIAVSVVLYGYIENMVFPGLTALLPCLGTAFCIASGNDGSKHLVQKILSCKLLVWIGLLSYSLYLWHWPIYVFYRQVFLKNVIDWQSLFILSFLTVALSLISFFFVETPIRRKVILKTRKNLFKAFFCFCFVLTSVCSFLLYSGNDFFIDARMGALKTSTFGGLSGVAQSAPQHFKQNDFALQSFGSSNTKRPKVLVIGDSFAQSFGMMFDEVAKVEDIQGAILYGYPAAIPNIFGAITSEKALQRAKYIYDYIEKEKFAAIVIILRPAWYIHGGTEYEDPKQTKFDIGTISYVDKNIQIKKDGAKALQLALKNFITYCTAKKIKTYILKPIPEMTFHVPNAAVQQSLFFDTVAVHERLSVSQDHYNHRNGKFLDIMKNINNLDFELLDPTDLFCENKRCYSIKDNTILYIDNNHISLEATRMLKDIFIPIFTGINSDY